MENLRNVTKAYSPCYRKLRISTLLRRVSRDDRGHSLIEVALVTPIFVLMLVGAVEFGLQEYGSIEASNAARAGVAYGSQSAATAADINGMKAAAASDGPDIGGLSATAKQFWSCSNAPSTQNTAPPTCTTGNHLLHYVQVNTTVTMNSQIRLPKLLTSYVLTGQAIMRVL